MAQQPYGANVNVFDDTYNKLKGTMPTAQTTDLSAYTGAVQPFTPVSAPSMSIANASPTVVNYTDLLNQAKAQAGTNYNVAAPDQRFNTPEHMNALVQQMMQMYQPQIQQQQQMLQQQYGQADTQMQERLAARGLLSSGMGADQQRALQQSLAQDMSGVVANAQASAIPHAMQFGQLGLSEQQQILDQLNQNRAFDYGQQSDLFDRSFGINRAQTGDDQWERNFQLQQYQTDLDRWARETGFNQQGQQSYLDNLARGLGMEMGQNQWAQDFNQQGNQFAQGQAMGYNQFLQNLTQQGSQFDRGLSEQQRQYNATLAQQQAQQRDYAAELGLRREMFNWDKERQLASDLGYYVDRTGSDPEGWNKNYTMQGQAFLDDKANQAVMQKFEAMSGGMSYVEQMIDKKVPIADGAKTLETYLNSMEGMFTPQEKDVIMRAYYAKRGVRYPGDDTGANNIGTLDQQLANMLAMSGVDQSQFQGMSADQLMQLLMGAQGAR